MMEARTTGNSWLAALVQGKRLAQQTVLGGLHES